LERAFLIVGNAGFSDARCTNSSFMSESLSCSVLQCVAVYSV